MKVYCVNTVKIMLKIKRNTVSVSPGIRQARRATSPIFVKIAASQLFHTPHLSLFIRDVFSVNERRLI